MEESKIINGIVLYECPRCGSTDFVRWGHTRAGVNRFKCNGCGGTFTPPTETLFDDHKIDISEWMEYLIHIFEFHSLKTSSLDNRNAITTGKYWLEKVFELLKEYQNGITIGKRVWIDETYLSVIHGDRLKDEEGKMPRGLSRNKICIATATDGLHSVFICENTCKPSSKSTWHAYSGHLLPGSIINHDGEKSHEVLFRRDPSLRQNIWISGIRYNKDTDNPMYPINHMHMLLKRFMSNHGSYKREELQDWMNLFAFIVNPPYQIEEKIAILLELACRHHKRMKYRDVMGKKYDK